MQEVTRDQIHAMHKYSAVFLILLGIMLVLAFIFDKLYSSTGLSFLVPVLTPFIIACWVMAYCGIKHKILGCVGFSYPTYYGLYAQIWGFLLILLSLYAILGPLHIYKVIDMTNGNVILGIILILVGLIALVGKIFGIKKMFWKLESFQKNYGEKWGNFLHTIGYIVIPLIAGAILIWFNL